MKMVFLGVPGAGKGPQTDCIFFGVQRSDDLRETVKPRLSVYEEQTAPLIKHYKGKNLLFELDGSGPVHTVQERLVALLSGPWA